jgi:ketosteroid isomerase-like protein
VIQAGYFATVSENLDLVRSIYQRWERGDWSDAAWADPEIEYVGIDGPEAAAWKGIAAMVQQWRAWLSAWEEYRAEAEEFREVDGERVLVLMWHGGSGKESGISFEEMRTPGATLFVIRDGKVTKLALYWDRDRALADLGLEE